MKKIFKIVFLLISFNAFSQTLVEIEPDSIYFEANIVDKGKYEVYRGLNNLVSSHTKPDKAKLKAISIKTLYPNDSVYVKAPNAEPTSKIKVFVDESKLSVLSDDILERIVILENRVDVQGETIGMLLNDLNYVMLRDSLKIATLERRIETLQTFIKDSITFIMETPIDYSLPIVKGFSHDTTGWLIDEEEQDFTYQNTMDYRYIVFDFNRPLVVGETYELTFNVITNGTAYFDIWFYPEDDAVLPNGFVSGRVTDQIQQEEGTYRLYYTVEAINRSSLGIRAKINDEFIISNVKILKQE